MRSSSASVPVTERGAMTSPACVDVPVDAIEHRADLVARLHDRLADLAGRDPRALLGLGLEQVAERTDERRPARRRRVPPTPAARAGRGRPSASTSRPSVIATLRTSSPVAGLCTSSECGSALGAGRVDVDRDRRSGARDRSRARPARACDGRQRRPRRSRSTGATSWIQRDSFWPGRRSSWRTIPGVGEALPTSSSMSASERNACQRSARCLSSPGVCAPRSSSTPNSVDSGDRGSSASSATCRCLMTR